MSTSHLPPAERSLIASRAANIRFAGMTAGERRAATAAATKARKAKWEQQADPEGRMSAEELADAVERLKRAHYSLMALRSARARRKRNA